MIYYKYIHLSLSGIVSYISLQISQWRIFLPQTVLERGEKERERERERDRDREKTETTETETETETERRITQFGKTLY